MRFTIQEYAQAYSISPEMVHSRIRRNRLNYIVENDTTYIVVPKHQVPYHVDNGRDKEESTASGTSPHAKATSANIPAPSVEKKTTVATVIGLYQKENRYLKLKIEELEAKVDRLISEKEQLLKEERERIEKVYMDKDTQLKTILELINTKLLQENSNNANLDTSVLSSEVLAQEPIEVEQDPSEPVELKAYLRSLNLKSSSRKIIKRRFAEAFGTDARIQLKNGLFYLDFDRYDYSDLLKVK